MHRSHTVCQSYRMMRRAATILSAPVASAISAKVGICVTDALQEWIRSTSRHIRLNLPATVNLNLSGAKAVPSSANPHSLLVPLVVAITNLVLQKVVMQKQTCASNALKIHNVASKMGSHAPVRVDANLWKRTLVKNVNSTCTALMTTSVSEAVVKVSALLVHHARRTTTAKVTSVTSMIRYALTQLIPNPKKITMWAS